jgi:hypothetical protein
MMHSSPCVLATCVDARYDRHITPTKEPEMPKMNEHGECVVCGEDARNCLCPEVVGASLTIGMPVSLTLNADGSVSVEIDLSEYADSDSSIFLANGDEATDAERDALIDRLEAILPTTLTFTIGA